MRPSDPLPEQHVGKLLIESRPDLWPKPRYRYCWTEGYWWLRRVRGEWHEHVPRDTRFPRLLYL